MAGGIAEALLTTAAGLLVAIPALVAYRYLRGRVDALVIQMEKESIKLVQAIDRTHVHTAARGARERRRGRGRVKFQLRRTDEPDLNMTSLIDVVLLLLIFFMMSTRFVDESRLTIRLPEAGIEPTGHRDARQRRGRGHRRRRLSRQRTRAGQQQPRHACPSPSDARRRGNRECRSRYARTRESTHQSVVTVMDVRRPPRLPADQYRHGQRWHSRSTERSRAARCPTGRCTRIVG